MGVIPNCNHKPQQLCYTIFAVGRRSVVLSVVFLICAAAWGESAAKTPLSFRLLSVHVKGLNHFKEDDIVRATGLRLGQSATDQDFQQAVEKLGDTGLFADVAYNYRYTSAGCDLDLQIAENDKLVPIVFDNFVWFSDDQLISLLRAQMPLFDGKLPLRGSFSDQVADALNAILAQRNISGHAEYLESGAFNGPLDSYVYQVKFHPVVIRNIDFPGAAPSELPALQAAAKPLSGQEYLRSKMRPNERLNLLPVYLARGYLKTQFADSQAKVVQDGPRTLVDVSFPVTPGIQYRVSQVKWEGVSAFPVEQLKKLLHLKNGEPANAVQLGDDLRAVQKLYGTKGYLMADILGHPSMDDSAATVAYDIKVTEGDVFHMGELLIDGIDSSAASKLAAQWQMKKGDVYDASYLGRFFNNMYHEVGLTGSYSVVPKENINREDKTVAVALHFVPKR